MLTRVAIALAVTLVAMPAAAQGWYTSAGLGITIANDRIVDRSPAPAGSIAIGYRWDVMRVELEAGAVAAFSQGSLYGIAGTVYVEPFHYHGITPYALATFGYGYMDGSHVWTGHGRTTPFYGAGLGVAYEINDRWSIAADVRRYLSDDERYLRRNGGRDSNGELTGLTNFRAYTVGVRLRYQFR